MRAARRIAWMGAAPRSRCRARSAPRSNRANQCGWQGPLAAKSLHRAMPERASAGRAAPPVLRASRFLSLCFWLPSRGGTRLRGTKRGFPFFQSARPIGGPGYPQHRRGRHEFLRLSLLRCNRAASLTNAAAGPHVPSDEQHRTWSFPPRPRGPIASNPGGESARRPPGTGQASRPQGCRIFRECSRFRVAKMFTCLRPGASVRMLPRTPKRTSSVTLRK